MALDGIVIANLVYELNNTILNSRISKIAQPENDELLLTCKGNNGTYKLSVSANASLPFVYLTEENKKKHHGKTKQGTKNPKAKLTEEQVIKIRQLHKDGVSNSELYKAFPQVSSTSIRDIINGKTWKHLL